MAFPCTYSLSFPQSTSFFPFFFHLLTFIRFTLSRSLKHTHTHITPYKKLVHHDCRRTTYKTLSSFLVGFQKHGGIFQWCTYTPCLKVFIWMLFLIPKLGPIVNGKPLGGKKSFKKTPSCEMCVQKKEHCLSVYARREQRQKPYIMASPTDYFFLFFLLLFPLVNTHSS